MHGAGLKNCKMKTQNIIKLKLNDEQINSELADQYDYYYVPALFDGNTKLHEGVASKDGLKKIFDQYLGH